MIRASFEEKQDESVIRLRLQGHAGQAKDGCDVVCAAASILAYTAAQTALYLYADGKLRGKPEIRLEKGDSLISMRPKEEHYGEALYTFFVAQVGYSLLAKNYPQAVALSMFGQASEP